MGHINYQSVLDLTTKDLADGVQIDLTTRPPACDSCILGKQVQNSVPRTQRGSISSVPLRKVYVDLTGPRVLSNSKNQYSVDILDDYTGHPWSFGATSKSVAFNILST